jgi:glycosyltransferase involved in cell wall biosynthesis
VVPCLNEAKHIGPVVSSIRKYVPAVFVVDDGSTDDTARVAEKAGAIVLRHPQRRGKGAALMTGCDAARKNGFSHVVTMDGDGQHAPEDLPSFLNCLGSDPPALVVGNRMAAPAGMPWLRRVVNWWMSRRLSKLCGQRLPDTQCGFRLIDLNAFSDVEFQTTRFEMESELLIAFAAAKLPMHFVPVRVIYGDERSKINPLKDAWRWFKWFRRARKRASGQS